MEPERRLSRNAMDPYKRMEPERRLSGNAMENLMDFFGARAAFEQKCNGPL